MKLVNIHETAKDSASRLSQLNPAEREASSPKHLSCVVKIDPNRTYQTVEGFGGALTEASAYVLSALPEEKREEVIASFFDPVAGHGWTLARTHINSCDFSLENWACVEQTDETLESFSMEKVEQRQLPLIKRAIAHAGGSLKLMLTPWSPPAWMKDNNDMNHGGALLKKYYPLWAAYIVRFIDELKARNVPVWCMSVQNEPEATQTWDSCRWTGTEEAEFAVNNLGPALEKAGYQDLPILVWDHNRDRLFDRMKETMSVPGADEYIGGAAFHWYSGDQYDTVRKTSLTWPGKKLLFTEGCVEGGARPGAWFPGERYAHNIINDLNSGCTGWIDWNIALDMEGGPNHVGNFCDAPVLVDTENKTVLYQSSWYYLGHFSRFIKPGAVRIDCAMDSWMTPATVDGRMGNTMESCAFRNPDGTIALVLCNRTEADMIYTLECPQLSEDKAFRCPPRGIQTLLIG
ncbi:glucosylceramidase [Treponema zuelzerae]|uniref:Glucosylceramidase n=1 Tax=Teretinema zuelzerae TaxID=156 RepID=A0AAE3EI58_9SPIR|nr:glycoside hydrolase family 30 beta sandwich domain-containing protein [Teretinema zuelzerae]MCD1654231.1 glucosylceramidase [Teretinema zuelzerae]